MAEGYNLAVREGCIAHANRWGERILDSRPDEKTNASGLRVIPAEMGNRYERSTFTPSRECLHSFPAGGIVLLLRNEAPISVILK
jgi:hypothetical protein